MLILVFNQASKRRNKSNSFQYLWRGFISGGVHDHSRMYFLYTGRWVDYLGRGGGAYKWQFAVTKITEWSHANRNIRRFLKSQILVFLFLGRRLKHKNEPAWRAVQNETTRTYTSSWLLNWGKKGRCCVTRVSVLPAARYEPIIIEGWERVYPPLP